MPSKLLSDRIPPVWVVATLCICALLVGCSGDDDASGVVTGVVVQAVFTADDPQPTPMSLRLAPGASSGDTFEIRVLVTDVGAFFGAAFRVAFDESSARFAGFSNGGSFIDGAGITTDFGAVADSGDAGVVLVYATRQGSAAGVDAVGSQLLITLSFTATRVTAGNAFTFDDAATRVVTTCPTPPDACTDVPDGDLSWSGGTLTAN